MPRHPHIFARLARKLFAALLVVFAAVVFAGAQQRPLITEDVDVVKPGIIRIETGFEFLQDIKFPLSGLRGDMTKVLDTRVSVGLSPMVEFQIEWTPQNLLSIKGHGPTPLDLKLGLQLFDKQLEVRDFHAQLLHFVGRRKRSRGRRCIGLSIGGRLRWRTRRKSFGQRAGPGRFCGCRRSRRRGNGARSGRCRRKKIA